MSWGAVALVVAGIVLLIPLFLAIFVACTHRDFGRSPPGAMLVIALYGVGAAVAIPAWQDYRDREHVAETILGTGALRAAIESAYRERGKPPARLMAPAGVLYDARDGSLSATPARDVLDHQPVRLIPSAGQDGKVAWKCTTSREPERFAKLMPKECR